MDKRQHPSEQADQNRTQGTGRLSGPLPAREVAALLGVNERTVRRAIARGELPATKQTGVFRITPAALDRYRLRCDAAHGSDIGPPAARLITLPSRQRVRANLPVPLTSLVGRAEEVAAVGALLQRGETRLLTLIGPGGVGKTRLAVEAAAAIQLREQFGDGVCFVDLAVIANPDLLAATIAFALGSRDTGDRETRDWLRRFLAPRELLLVLDNFERIVAAAPLVPDLLAAAPRLKVLATSRMPLRVSGEWELPVLPLTLPSALEPSPVDAVLASAAGRLFVERARAVDPAFRLDAANAPAIADICRRLDGLPLAIELAVARIGHLALPLLRERLEQRLPLLTGGARDLPTRLRTMRNAIAWSHDLLPPAEQTLFRRLAVFTGGFTLEVAEAVSRGEPSRGVAGSRGRGVEQGTTRTFFSTLRLLDPSRRWSTAVSSGTTRRRPAARAT